MKPAAKSSTPYSDSAAKLTDVFAKYYSTRQRRNFWRIALGIPELRRLMLDWLFSGLFRYIPFWQVRSEILLLGLLRFVQSGLSQGPHFHVTCNFDTSTQTMTLDSKEISSPEIAKMSEITPTDTPAISFWLNVERALAERKVQHVVVVLFDPNGSAGRKTFQIELHAISALLAIYPDDVAYALRISTSPAYGPDHRMLQKILSEHVIA